MSSDDSMRQGSRGFIPSGVGMAPTFRCDRCQQTKSTTGRRNMAPRGSRLFWWRCSVCVEAKALA